MDWEKKTSNRSRVVWPNPTHFFRLDPNFVPMFEFNRVWPSGKENGLDLVGLLSIQVEIQVQAKLVINTHNWTKFEPNFGSGLGPQGLNFDDLGWVCCQVKKSGCTRLICKKILIFVYFVKIIGKNVQYVCRNLQIVWNYWIYKDLAYLSHSTCLFTIHL